jgi:signal transduction histidine kinase/DNA-binding response OmpR family regulator
MAFAHGQVLFVCDHPASNRSLDIVSTELGQALVRVHCAAEALAQVRRADYALILVAYAGDAQQLLDTVRRMRSNSRSSYTPIVALGLPPQPPFELELVYEAGAVAVLTDPLSPTILRAKARFYLDAFADAQERRRAEAELADARERLENVIALAELGVWSWDVRTNRVSVDRRMAAMFGLADRELGEALLPDYLEALHPDDRQPTRELVAQAARTGAPYHATYRIRAGADTWRWIIARGQVDLDEHGQASRMRGVVIDATRQFEAEQQLRANEERHRIVFESLDEGLCVIEMLYDAAGRPCDYRFLQTNPAFVKHTGLVAAVGRTMREMAPAHERHWFEIYGRVADTGEPARFVNEAKELGRWYDVYATRIGPPAARQVAVLFSDITERRRADEELKRLAADLAETNRLKTEFLATLAHELRNPLAPIRSGLQFMRRARGDSAAIARVQDIMDRQLDHLVNLVDDLLDVARITRGQVELKREWLDLGTVLSAAVETSMPLIEAARHRLDVRLPPEALALYADPTRLTQVVSNLLNNAARYTPKGGSIVLAAERDGEHAVVAVSDNGMGIAPESLEEVFKMFTQVGNGAHRGPGGLGIGLSLVRSLVELHGGRVNAASAGANAGSVFTVRLPLAPAGTPAPPEPDAPPIAAAHQGLRVLVVDDNRDAAETLSALLGLMGHTAPVANDGHQALRMIPTFRPHVVFLDIGMPGLSGYEAAAAIRRDPLFDAVRLVALTGWGGEGDRARSAEAGFDLHLTKPATTEALERALAGLAG